MDLDVILQGDCLGVLAGLPADSVDLIVTSPPYSDQRKSTYGGVKPEQYVEWFLPRSEQMKRVLKPEGSFILNIKEKAVNGERSTYVLELILALRTQGWLWTEEYIWHKTSAAPGKWPNRFRDSWERLLHFTRLRDFKMYQEAVMVDPAESTVRRGRSTNKDDKSIDYSATGSGVRVNRHKTHSRNRVYPTNVLTLSPVNTNVGHSAAYPVALPNWFIRLFTQAGDVVLDPFIGSGTTAIAAKQLGRHYIGVELLPDHIAIAEARIAAALAAPEFVQLSFI